MTCLNSGQWLVFIFLCLAVYKSVLSQSFNENSRNVGTDLLNTNWNRFLDKQIANLRLQMKETGTNVYPLPSDKDTFNVTLFGKDILGEVCVDAGQVSGLGTIRRTNDTEVQLIGLTKIRISSTVGLTGLAAESKSYLKLGMFEKDFNFQIRVSSFSIAFQATANIFKKIVLEKCAVADLRYVTIQLKGLGIIESKLLSEFADIFLQVFNPLVKKEVEKILCHLLKQHFHK